MKKILAFRIDRLGDYIICSKLLYSLKKKYGYLTIVCSNHNYKLINKQKFIDEIVIYDKNYSLLKKINIFFKLFFDYYFLIISWDGKKFSNLCSFLLFSKNKVCLVYKKFQQVFSFNFNIYRPNKFLTKIFFDKILFFTSRKNLTKTEHLPTIYANLLSQYTSEKNHDYFLDISKESEIEFNSYKEKMNLKDYIFFHIDEKWSDIDNIDHDLFNAFLKLSYNTSSKIIVSSYKNKENYYNSFKKNFKTSGASNIYLLEDLNIELMERFINYSKLSVSCHSGYFIQTTGFNKANVIDIINENEKLWVSCWQTLNNNYKQIYKNDKQYRFNLEKIFKEIQLIYEKKL